MTVVHKTTFAAPCLGTALLSKSGMTMEQKRGFHASRPAFAKDYYEVLGLQKGASASEIKKAYYQMAKKYHPDTNKDNPEAQKHFQEVGEAYETLRDEEKRKIYDQYGHAGFDGGMGGGQGGFRQGFGNQGGFNPEDLFRDFESVFRQAGMDFDGFGNSRGGQRQSAPMQGGHVQSQINLSFMEAVKGCTKRVRYSKVVECESCGGTGSAPGSSRKTCTRCGGTGEEVMDAGIMKFASTCRKCQGMGTILTDPCSKCDGTGRIRTNEEISVDIPAGVDTGMDIRISGAGNAGVNGGPPGNLYVTVNVASSREFKRDGANIHSSVNLNYLHAILGGSVDIEGIDGLMNLKVPNGSQPGDVLRLRGRGIKHIDSSIRGDHFVTLNVVLPQRVTEVEKEALLDMVAQDSSLLNNKRIEINGLDDHVEKQHEQSGESDNHSPDEDSGNTDETNEESAKDCKGKKKGLFSKIKEAFTDEVDSEKKKKAAGGA
eukprot:Clim_evm59s147 gene=Clim_evmTU59s147